MKIAFGVLDIPYANDAKTTTGDVAEILESKYGVMAAFYESHSEKIADAMMEGLADQLAAFAAGAPMPSNPFAQGEADTEQMFRDFLSSAQIEKMGIPGVPTQAALDGINHRKKVVRTGEKRPSFIDTGMYQQAFKCEVKD